jgi:hypothetical protein
VPDSLRALDDAQEQVVILRAIILRPEAADLIDQRAADDNEVADVIVGEKEVGRPIRLQQGRVESVLGELVFIAVDEIRFGLRLQQLRGVKERIGFEQIVVIEQRDPLSGLLSLGRDSTPRKCPPFCSMRVIRIRGSRAACAVSAAAVLASVEASSIRINSQCS